MAAEEQDAERAPLLWDAAPATGEAFWIRAADGVRLRAALFPATSPRGSVLLSSGRTEFIEKYGEVIGELVGRGFSVLTHDWRGQGLSDRLLPDRLKGHARSFDDFVADHRLLLDRFEARLPGPRIGVSHSMGGCLTALALAGGERRLDAAIFSAPMFGIAGEHIALIRLLVWCLTKLGASPHFAPSGARDPFAATFEGNALTHDRARFERTHAMMLEHRELGLGPVTWGWIESAFVSMTWLDRALERGAVGLPVTVVAAGQEHLVDIRRERRFAELVSGARYVEIPHALHEILMETDEIREIFWAEFDALALKVSRTA